MSALLLLLACSNGPTVLGVDPVVANPGQTVSVMGENFADNAEAFLQKQEGSNAVAFEHTDVKGPVILEAVIPAGIQPGVYGVGVRQDGAVHSMPGVLTIEKPKADTPCAGEYTANTQVSLARKEVVVDRFYREKERETLRIPLREITRIEYELVKTVDGKLCSVIFMRTNDGKRVMFDDDTEVDLKERAYKLGQTMGKPVETTREDAAEMGKPTEAP